jgi:hypothetical protein
MWERCGFLSLLHLCTACLILLVISSHIWVSTRNMEVQFMLACVILLST